MSYYIPITINILLFAFPFLMALSRFKYLDKAMKVLAISCGLSLLAEVVAVVQAHSSEKNNVTVYGIYNFVEIFAACMYFNYSIRAFHKYNIGLIIALLCIIIGFLNSAFLQPLNTVNNYFIYFQGIVIISLCMILMTEQLKRSEKSAVGTNPHFYVASINLIFWVISFLYWGINGYLRSQFTGAVWLINNMMILVCSIVNIALGLIFLKFNKSRII